MSIIRRLAGLPDRGESRSVSYQDVWGAGLDVTPSTASGERVTPTSALTLSTVYACVRLLADAVSELPAQATRGKGAEATPAERPPTWLDEPSPLWRRIDVWNQLMTSLLLHGNAYVFTLRDATGAVLELWPVNPDDVSVTVTDRGPVKQVAYMVAGVPMSFVDLLHVRGMLLPGRVCGVSPVEAAAETIGLGLGAQKYGARFFGGGAVPGGIVEAPGAISPDGIKLLRQSWRELHSGAGNAHKLAVLTEGASYKPISLPPEQAQFLATRQFQVADIARVYGVAPHLVGDASGSTSWGSGLAEQSTNTVTYSLRPWVTRLEQGLTWLARSERPTVAGARKLHVRLDVDHLTRGTFEQQVRAIRLGVEGGLFNLDEGRAMLGRPPLPDGAGRIHRSPANLAPVDPVPEDGDPIDTPTVPAAVPPAGADL